MENSRKSEYDGLMLETALTIIGLALLILAVLIARKRRPGSFKIKIREEIQDDE